MMLSGPFGKLWQVMETVYLTWHDYSKFRNGSTRMRKLIYLNLMEREILWALPSSPAGVKE